MQKADDVGKGFYKKNPGRKRNPKRFEIPRVSVNGLKVDNIEGRFGFTLPSFPSGRGLLFLLR